MFLRGKGNLVVKQSKEQEQKSATKPKALGGWQDDEQDTNNAQPTQQQNPTSTNNSQEPVSAPSQPAKKDEFRLYNSDELSEHFNLEYETKLVNDITQPGGIRVKPNENLLIEFSKAAKTLDVPIIGSLLISKLELDYPYALKAKALYTMEYIAKKIDKYQAYFKRHSDYVRGLSLPEDNQQQYQTLLEDTLNGFQGVEKSNKVGSEGVLEFTDPGYNVPQKGANQNGDAGSGVMGLLSKASDRSANKPVKGPTKTFISPEELKKKKQMEEGKKTEPINILDANTPPQKQPQQPKIDIFSLEGLKIDDKPTVPVVPNITVPTVPTVPQQPFNLYDPKLPANYQNMPQQPPQNMQYPGYTYYPYGPMQMPMMPTGYVMPQYPTNGQYPAGGYAYTQKPPVQPNQQPSANPSKQITGDNLYNIASK